MKHATVIGGGIAGLKGAIDLARRGIEVALIEKVALPWRTHGQVWTGLPQPEKTRDQVRLQLAGEVLSHKLITVHTCARVSSYHGYVREFQSRDNKRELFPVTSIGAKTGSRLSQAQFAAASFHSSEFMPETHRRALKSVQRKNFTSLPEWFCSQLVLSLMNQRSENMVSGGSGGRHAARFHTDARPGPVRKRHPGTERQKDQKVLP